MPIPKFHQIMLPLLNHYNDGKVYHRNTFIEILASEFDLTVQERSETVSNGNSRFADRVWWAGTFLKKGGLLTSPKRGYHQITQRGMGTLQMGLTNLNPDKIIELYPDVLNDPFYNPELRSKTKSESTQSLITEELTPDESLDQAVSNIKARAYGEILDQIKLLSPLQFERLVVKVLVSMGYGTTEFSFNTQYTNDGGIDGIIQGDELGFERIYVQAKKYEGSVGRPDIQKFVGAMTGTQKGVFITTSDFTKNSHDYIATRQENIILINGEQLVEFMYKYNQGVSVRKIIELKTLDSDYFEEL